MPVWINEGLGYVVPPAKPSVLGDAFDVKPGVTVPAAIHSRVQWVAQQFLAITGTRLLVSDGPRTEAQQAALMIEVIQGEGGRERLVKDYQDALALEVVKAFDDAVKAGATGAEQLARVTEVILGQRKANPSAYAHLNDAAVDFSFARVSRGDQALAEALVQQVAGAESLRHGARLHLHVAFKTDRPFEPPTLLIFGFALRDLRSDDWRVIVSRAEAFSRSHALPVVLHAEATTTAGVLRHEFQFINGTVEEQLTNGLLPIDVESHVGRELTLALRAAIERGPVVDSGPQHDSAQTPSRASSSSSDAQASKPATDSGDQTAWRAEAAQAGADARQAARNAQHENSPSSGGSVSLGVGVERSTVGDPSVGLRITWCYPPGFADEDVLAVYFALLKELIITRQEQSSMQPPTDDGREPLDSKELVRRQLRALLEEKPDGVPLPSRDTDNNADYLRELEAFLRRQDRAPRPTLDEFRPQCGTPASLETLLRDGLGLRGGRGGGAR